MLIMNTITQTLTEMMTKHKKGKWELNLLTFFFCFLSYILLLFSEYQNITSAAFAWHFCLSSP